MIMNTMALLKECCFSQPLCPHDERKTLVTGSGRNGQRHKGACTNHVPVHIQEEPKKLNLRRELSYGRLLSNQSKIVGVTKYRNCADVICTCPLRSRRHCIVKRAATDGRIAHKENR